MNRRIAMWSGPRNISTALMRSWENRADCAVVDEPLYAFYLHQTGLHHPGRTQILQSQSTSWQDVAQQLVGDIPHNAPIWYQKHMVHHLLPSVDRSWLLDLDHCFLIREPAEVLSSYIRSRPDVCLDDLGFVQQTELFDWLSDQTGRPPLVVDSADVLRNPEACLRHLCKSLHLPFDDAMLNWPAGPRESDGIWAPHWYAAVESSTGFKPYRVPALRYPPHLETIVQAARPHYQRLFAHRLTP